MDTVFNSLKNEAARLLDHIPEIVGSLFVLIVAHFIGRGIRRVYHRVIRRGDVSTASIHFIDKLIYGFVMGLGILLALNVLGFSGLVTSILASGGITAVILGFAFKDIGENFLAGFFMAFSRPFRNGDLIESEGITGRVQNIELRHTHLRTPDGCDVFIPSAQLLSKPLFNYTRDGLRRGSFTVGIDYGDDADRACRLLLDDLKEEPKVIAEPPPLVQVSGFNPLFVELTVYFWIEVDPRKQEVYLANVQSLLMENARTTLLEHGFTFSSGVTTAVEMQKLDVNIHKDESQGKS